MKKIKIPAQLWKSQLQTQEIQQDLSSGPHPAVAYPDRARLRHSLHEVFHLACGTLQKYPKVVTIPWGSEKNPQRLCDQCGPRVIIDTQRLPWSKFVPSKSWSITSPTVCYGNLCKSQHMTSPYPVTNQAKSFSETHTVRHPLTGIVLLHVWRYEKRPSTPPKSPKVFGNTPSIIINFKTSWGFKHI